VPAARFRVDKANGVIRNWEPVAQNAGEFGCAVILDPSSIVDVVEAENNQLIVAKPPAVYYVGSAWNRSGDFVEVADFDRAIDQWIQRVKSPLRVEVTP
jgi:hypothetical protein